MKRLIAVLIPILSFITLNVNAQKIKWYKFEEGMKVAEKQKKKVFIDVFTDWCGYCVKMDKTTFMDKDVVEYMNENYIAIKFDAESIDTISWKGYTFKNPNPTGRRSTNELAAALLNNKLSYPSYVLFDENQVGITIIPGYMPKTRFLPIMHFIKEDAYKTTKFEDYLKKYNEKNNG
ncbi:MAG: thioredoxin family protein [Hyphomicrobiales bacterium]